MATHKIRMMGLARHGVWMVLVLVIVFLSVRLGRTQDEPASPLRARQTLQQAIDLYQRFDYEKAAAYFAAVGPMQQLLSPTDSADFTKMSASNTIALKGRQDGAAQVQLAESALKESRLPEAANLLKSLNVNQYLAPADRQQLTELNKRMATQASAANAQGKADAKSLLAQGRAALQKGDLATAETLAKRAEKASSLIPQWLRPWDDSADKLLRDVQTARAKLAAPPQPEVMPKSPEPAAASTSKFGALWPFGGSIAKKDDLSPAGNLAMARHMVKDGFVFLQANDLDKAQFVAVKAKEMNVAYQPGEPTPDLLLQEIQKRKGIAVPPPPSPETAKVEPKAEPLPKNADARTLLKHARGLLEKKKYDEAEKVCSMARTANARWGLFEDTPEKLRRDILTLRQSSDRDESIKLIFDARKLFVQGSLEEAEKKAFRAKQLHGPYGVFDFGDRPDKLLEEINRAKIARGPVKDNPLKDSPIARDGPKNVGVPFENPARVNNENKNRAIVMLGHARELERRGLLTDARQKALEAHALKAVFQPDEDSPEAMLLSLQATCDRQIVAHLQQAVRHGNDAADAERFVKAQEQILAARKLAQAFQLDAGKIDQTQRHLQQIASGDRAPTVPNPIATVGDISTGDPKKDERRKLGREKLQQAQIELSYGKTKQARKMAEDVFNADCGLNNDALALIRSISAEEYNQQILEAKRNFDAGVDAFLQKDYRKAAALFGMIDMTMLPEPYQIRLRDIMATRDMQPGVLAQGKEQYPLKGERIVDKGPVKAAGPMDPVEIRKAKDLVQFQALRHHGQEALRTAHDMYKNSQKDEAIETLQQFVAQVDLVQLEPQKANELKRLPEGRIQHYRTMMAEEDLKSFEKSGTKFGSNREPDRQAKIRKQNDEMAERMKVVTELFKQNKLKEAEVEARKLREIDPENTAVLQALHQIVNKRAQAKYDEDTHRDERNHIGLLGDGMGDMPEPGQFVKFGEKHKAREPGDGSILHGSSDPKVKAIEYRLRQPISLNFKDTPLDQVIRDLSAMSGINVQPDTAALEDAKVNLQSLLTIDVSNIDMKSALNILLSKLRLAYTIENQCLMITTPDRTRGRVLRKTFPVGDLVVVVPDYPLPDVFNMQKAIERSMIPQGVYGNNYLTPPAYTFNAGEPVSAHSNGLGGAFGDQSTSGAKQPKGGVKGQSQSADSKQAMAEVLMELIQATVAKNSWESMGGHGSIQYFPFGMALVINQPQEVQEEVALLLATLRRLQDLQVSVELRAVLVSETFFERIGVDFNMNISTPTSKREPDLVAGNFVPAPFINRTGAGLGGLISGLTNAGTLTPDLNIPIRNSTFNFTTPQFGGYQPEAGLTLGLAFLSEIQVFMFLEAVQGDRRAHIMQAPKLTVFNGQQATISGFMIRPTVSGLQPAALGNGQIMMLPQISQMPFGLTMTVQPVVSPDRRFIRLNVTPQMANGIQDPAGAFVIAVPGSVPATFDGGGAQPFFANNPLNVTINPSSADLQIANTTVNVPDGGTVLLGGFKFLAEERSEYGPPILSKIPYLSRLFRNVGWSRDGSTLIYLVTARVIMVEEEEQIFLGNVQR